MILPDFVLPSRVGQCWEQSGLDSFDCCLDKKRFDQYPYKITYQYNNRGFRDQEWPDSWNQLANAIWCLGDSFTVGLGSPIEHTWPWLLEHTVNRRSINVSMDGASNNWIARKALSIIKHIQPSVMVIHWSFFHRRELPLDSVLNPEWQRFYNQIKDPSWPDCDTVYNLHSLPEFIQQEITQVHNFDLDQFKQGVMFDEERRLYHAEEIDPIADINNTVDLVDQIECQQSSTLVVHSVVPGGIGLSPTDPSYKMFETKIQSLNAKFIPEFGKIDLSRDGFHYDIKTASFFVQQIVDFL